MAKANEVARYLVYLASCTGDEPDYLTHLRLQKLLYYTQGWSIALRGRALFSERIEAWAHGPVVRDLYPHFASASKEQRAITAEDFTQDEEFDLTDEEMEHVSGTWETFKQYSASSLRKMTHEEPPWSDARRGYGPADRCDVEITQEAMRRYFDSITD